MLCLMIIFVKIFYSHLKMYEIKYKKGNELEIEKRLTDLETKYLKLIRLKK